MNKNKLKKLIEQVRDNKYIHYFIIILIGILLTISLSKIQLRDTHDGILHLLRVIGTDDTLKIGQIPPLINQNYCNGVGYSMNLFYQPIVTYLPLLIKLFTPTYALALKIFASLCITISGISMYQFTYQVTKKRSIALFSAIFYLIAPYKLANAYIRFAIGEFAALAFLPWVFLGLYNLLQQDGKKHYYIAIGAIGLALSHTITTFYAAIFCVIYILFNIKKLKDKEIIKKGIINIIFILLISMMFYLPLFEATSAAEYTLMNNEIMGTNGDFVAQNTISFVELLKTKDNQINGKEVTAVLGIPTIIILLSTIFTFKKIDNKYKDLYLLFIIFGLVSVFMASKFFPWTIMPSIICKLQYPWRMIGFLTFFISFICGINLYIILKSTVKKDILKIVIILLFVIASIISSMSIISKYFSKNDTLDKMYETNIMHDKKISCARINRDYMPCKAIVKQRTYVMDREDKTYILQGQANITNEKKENLTDVLNVKDIKEGTILEFPYYYYVGYEIILETENKKEKIESVESENGYISCVMLQDINEGVIQVKYVGTLVTKISYITSGISFILFIIYIIFEKRENKREIKEK